MSNSVFRLGCDDGPLVKHIADSPRFGARCLVVEAGVWQRAMWGKGTYIWVNPKVMREAAERWAQKHPGGQDG